MPARVAPPEPHPLQTAANKPKPTPMKKLLLPLLALVALAASPAIAQQTLQIVNDAHPAWSDDDVYLLFTANPASVTANGATISGVRDASLPIGTVSNSTNSTGSTLVSTTFTSRTLPATPFPIQFLSGNNSTPVGNATAAPVFEVTAYNSGSGSFTVNGTLLPMSTSDQFVVGAYSQKLSSLPVVGNLTSSLSGRTQKIHQVTLGNNFAAGVVFVSYGAPLTYTTASPSPSQTKTLFQIFEVTTASGSGSTTSDLTYIDAYGFPLQIESIDTSSNSTVDRRTFYFSGNTVASDLDAIGTLTTNTTILRLGPGQFASANNGNPSPFPSFANYLQALLSANQTQTIAGTQAFGTPNPTTVYGVTVVGDYVQTYSYNASLSSSGGGNFTYTLTPFGTNTITGNTSQGTPPNGPPYFPPIADVTSLTVNLPADTLNETIYGCTLTSQSFQVNVSGAHSSLVPTTLSGPFQVTNNGSSSTTNSFQVDSLKPLAVGQLAGLTVNFLSGSNTGNQSTINGPVSSNGVVSLTTPLPNAPQPGDQFEILFQVNSATNTLSSFQTTLLGANNLNYITGNITFVSCNSLSANNTNQTVAIAAVDSIGNIRLQTALNSIPIAGDLFRVSVANSDVQTQLYTNSGFAWVAADVMSALNLGFLGGTAGDSSAEWFGQFPQEFPYGLARPEPDDGFYNPWGAYFYNASDGYAFAFSDRINPSPLLSTSPGNQTLRLTILPHDQIDAPLVTATTTNSSINLAWTPESGVSYSVQTVPELPNGGNVSVQSANGTARITSLPPGTPFEISVIGSKGNQTSYTLPQIFSTNGTANAVTGRELFALAFTWTGGSVPLDYNRYNVTLNGQKLAFSGGVGNATALPIKVSGGNGTNFYVIDFIDTQSGNQSVLKSVLQLDLANVNYSDTGGSFTVQNVTNYNAGTQSGSLPGQAVLGSSGAVLVTGVAESSTADTATYNIPASPGFSPLSVAINFTPVATKQFAPVVVVTDGPEISVSASLNPFSTTNGNASVAQSFTASGTRLEGNILVQTSSGFEVSTDNSSFTSNLTLAPASGSVPPTSIYARIAASATVGSLSGNISLTSTNATTQNVAVTGNVTSGSGTPYQNWVAYWTNLNPSFSANSTGSADPDGDGYVNDTEFAFDGNPTVPTASLLTATTSGVNMTVTFIARNTTPAGATYQVQETTNLNNGFVPSAVSVTESTDQSGILVPAQYQRRQFTVPMTDPKKFYRIRATLN